MTWNEAFTLFIYNVIMQLIFNWLIFLNLINFTAKYPMKLIMPHLQLTYIAFMQYLFIFFFIHKKKVLDLRKFLTTGFRRIYMFWDVWIRFSNFWKMSVWLHICVSVCMSPKFCGHCISRINVQKLMKLYIHLNLDIIQCWLDFGAQKVPMFEIFVFLWNFFNTVL